MAGDLHIPAVWGADLTVPKDKLPFIVFSHGLGASRFTYSEICLQLASHGIVVASVEHRF
jgi:platelet-activating factor acetylhydrolase